MVLPALFCLSQRTAAFAAESFSVTIFCILFPSAVSIASEYSFFTLKICESGPIIPCNFPDFEAFIRAETLCG